MGEEESIADVPVPDDDEAEKDPILDLAIDYAVQRTYPDGLSKEKKRAVRKRAATLIVEKGEVFFEKEKALGKGSNR